MSNPYQQTVQAQPSKYNNPGPPVETNGLAIAGFVVSLIGLFLCGIPSIIGLVVSLLAMRKQPRGFAVAGVVLGLVGMLLMVVCGFAMYASYRTAQSFGNTIGTLGSQMQADVEAGTIGEQWKKTGEVPAKDAGQKLLKSETDIFGNPFVYETDGTSFSIRSAGPDGKDGTEDDIVSGPFQEAQEAIDAAPKVDEEGNFDIDLEGLESGDLMEEMDFESEF